MMPPTTAGGQPTHLLNAASGQAATVGATGGTGGIIGDDLHTFKEALVLRPRYLYYHRPSTNLVTCFASLASASDSHIFVDRCVDRQTIFDMQIEVFIKYRSNCF